MKTSEPANERSAAVLSRSSPEGCEDFLKLEAPLVGSDALRLRTAALRSTGMPLPRRDGNLPTSAATVFELKNFFRRISSFLRVIFFIRA